MDQIFSRISFQLSKTQAVTYDELAYVIMKSYTPNHNVQKLKRTFDVHPWLLGTMDKSSDNLEVVDFSPCLETHWDGITEPHQFMIEPCRTDNETGVGVSIKAADFSSSDWGPPMYPFRNLPRGKPQLNAARQVFSHWERDNATNKLTGNRTSDDQAKKEFAKSQEMICSPNGPITEMDSLQREQWVEFFKQLAVEQCLPAAPLELWFPETKADVIEHLASIAKEKTPDEVSSGMICSIPPREPLHSARTREKCNLKQIINFKPSKTMHNVLVRTRYLFKSRLLVIACF